jgi:stearoyl-CoA desaturase (Delta-9 desaturase)
VVPEATKVDPSGTPAVATVRTPVYRSVLTAIVTVGPFVTALLVLAGGLGRVIPWFDIALATIFFFVIGHGVTVGFHRLFTHRSFVACRPLKIGLAVLGSMAFQGSLIGWVADHRRHHRFSDRPGDPHSPYWRGDEPLSAWRGFWHGHVGWTFTNPPTSRSAYAADLMADPDLVLIDRLFVPCCVATLMLPFAIGYMVTGTVAGAFGALVWAGVLRIGFSHNVTWSINSICHRFGKRPFRTRDNSTNVSWLALFTAGESYHNAHHAFPTSARHGVEPRELDTSAALIRLFERLGWATEARWPRRMQLDARRI